MKIKAKKKDMLSLLCGAICGLCVAIVVSKTDDLSDFLEPSKKLTKLEQEEETRVLASSRNPTHGEQKKGLEILNIWTEDLKKELKRINFSNHREIIYNKICSLMEQLKGLEKKHSLPSQQKENFIISVLKIYDKVLSFSLDHHIVGCLYDYYLSSTPRELLKLQRAGFSSASRFRLLKENLKLYERELKEGNG